jgi:hypothetical protein
MAIKRRAREDVKETAIDRGERGAKKSMPIADIGAIRRASKWRL